MRIIYLLVCVFSLTVLFESIAESAIPSQAETPTETPTKTPTVTPIPLSPTNTPTLLSVPYTVEQEHFWVDQILSGNRVYTGNYSSYLMGTHPTTGDIALVLFNNADGSDFRNPIRYYHLYFVTPNAESPIEMPLNERTPDLEFAVRGGQNLVDMSISENGVVYVLSVKFGPSPGGSVTAIMPDNTTRTWFPFSFGRAIHVVKSTDNIPDTKPGDVLVLNWEPDMNVGLTNVIYKIDPILEDGIVEVYMGPEGFPQGVPFADINTGIDNQLFFLTYGSTDYSLSKILYLQPDKTVSEWFHQDMNIATDRFEFYSPYPTFFIAGGSQIHWTFESKRTLPVLGNLNFRGNHITSSKDHDAVYFITSDDTDSRNVKYAIHELKHTAHPLAVPTATPGVPTPTPTPIAGWLVLDGFGGIHQSNPSIPRPVLPYLPWNIIRDIEPDPKGRGWYMLDGYGGIHTSNPALPKPVDLPYFGFDIARNLEVKQDVRGGYHFFMLDGYGGMHTNNPSFYYGSLPFLGIDVMRDLEPVDDNGWMVMDVLGNTYENFGYFRDKITYAHPSSYYPIMRGMVRFPDDTKVMIDHFAGRHTNPFHPAWDKAAGLPNGFYFPGYDIIWDIEVIPQNLTGN